MAKESLPFQPGTTLSERLDVDFVLKAAGLGVWELDPVTNVINWDDRCCGLYGLTNKNRLPYEQAIRHIHADDVSRVDEAVRWAMNPQSGGKYDVTYRTVDPSDGRLRWVRFMGQGYFTEAGEVYRLAGVAQDVTKDVQLQQEQISLLQAVFDGSVAGISVLRSIRDEAGRIVDFDYQLANRVTEQSNNRTDLVGQRYSAVHTEYKRVGLFDNFITVVETGQSIERDVHYAGEGFDNWYATVIVKHNDGVVFSFRDITAERTARQQIDESEERFRTMAEGSDLLITISNESGKSTYLNQAWVALTGQSVTELLDMRWVDLVHPDDRDPFLTSYRSALARHESFSGEFRIRNRQGAYRWLLMQCPARFRPDGTFAGYVSSCVDITDRKQAEEDLRASEARFRSLVEEAPVATGLYVGREMTIAIANDILLNYWNKDESVLGKPLRQAVPELEGQGFFERLEEVFESGNMHEEKAAPVKLSYLGAETSYYVDYTFKPLRNADGVVYAILNTAVDVTNQVNARLELTQQKTYLQNALSIADLGTFFVDVIANTATYSENIRRWYGLSHATESFDTVLGKIHPEDLQQVQEVIGAALQSEDHSHHDFVFRIINPAEGGEVYVRSFGKAQYKDGRAESIMGVLQNVTEQVLARRKLEESEGRFRNIVQQSPAATLVLRGNDFVIEQINSPMLWFMGRNKEVIGQPLLAVMPELTGQFAWQQVQRVYHEGVSFDQDEIIVPHNRTGVMQDYYYNVAYRPLREGEQITGMIQVATDVTEQVVARRKLKESEERYRNLSAELEQQVQDRTAQLQTSVQDLRRSNDNLQQFAYIASHDLQEPLRKIQQFGDLLLSRYADELGEARTYLERMRSAASRMSTLIKDLLSFSRISTQQNATALVPLNGVVNDVLTDLDVSIQETGAQVQVEPLPTVPGDASQLGQLFQNLVSNALKFRRQDVRPVIRISCQRVAAQELPASVLPARQAASYYRIDVSDNGIGFNDKYVDRIFQVFQRLHGKSEFAGTGIGLAICEKVVANHGGAITATSQPGQGATFNVYFPE